MAKAKIVFACQSCGYQAAKWLGKCPDCNQWNTFAEDRFEKASSPRGEISLGTKEDPAPIHEIYTSEEGRVL
jgi:DNA repair protein RadA/Sms